MGKNTFFYYFLSHITSSLRLDVMEQKTRFYESSKKLFLMRKNSFARAHVMVRSFPKNLKTQKDLPNFSKTSEKAQKGDVVGEKM